MYHYRMLQQADLPWLERAAFAGAWETLSAQERVTTPVATIHQRALQQWQEVLSSPMGFVLLACVGAQPVGFLLGGIGQDGTTGEWNGHMITIWVSPEHRRRGVGRQLQAQTERLFAHGGIRKAKLWSALHNQSALRMAWRAGYKPEGLIGMKDL